MHRRERRSAAGETLTGEVEIEREKEGKQRKSHSFLPINPSSKESVLARCCRNLREIAKASVCHGCQMAIARFLYHIICVWPFGPLDYGSAPLRCKICHLATLVSVSVEGRRGPRRRRRRPRVMQNRGSSFGPSVRPSVR